jgi:hypothetical protein
MLSSLIQNGFLYSKPLISDIQSVVFSTEDILDIPEADLWGKHKNDDDKTEDPKNKKEDGTEETAEDADDESDDEEVREKIPAHKTKPSKDDEPESSDEDSDESGSDGPSADDLKELFDAIPMEPAANGWDRDLPIMVVPLSLDDFMECFWADDSPYFIPAIETAPTDEIVQYSLWADPTEEDKAMFGDSIISIRKIEKKVHVGLMSKLYAAPNVIQQIALTQ